MAKIISFTVILLIVTIISLQCHYGNAKTRYVVRRTKAKNHNLSKIRPQAQSQSPDQIYILRRKAPRPRPPGESPFPDVSITEEEYSSPESRSSLSSRNRNSYSSSSSSSSASHNNRKTSSFSIPILSSEVRQRQQQGNQRRFDSIKPEADFIENTDEEQYSESGPTDWVSLEQADAINKAFEIHRQRKQPFTITNIQLDEPSGSVSSASRWDQYQDQSRDNDDDQEIFIERAKTPIMVDGRDSSSINSFKSNIPLPRNPYIKKTYVNNERSDIFNNIGRQHADIRMDGERVDTYAEDESSNNYNQAPTVSVYQAGSKSPGLEDVLNKYLETLHKTKNTNSRSDTILSTIKTAFNNGRKHIAHYTKPGSFNLINNKKQYPQPHHNTHHTYQQTQDHIYSPSEPQPQSQPQQYEAPGHGDTFISLLSKLKKISDIKDAFPPHGSYTPYGERTIIMVKYPGMPSDKTPNGNLNLGTIGLNMFGLGLGGVRPISIPKNTWSSSKFGTKESDLGVIISQNYILQPDVSLNSHYNGYNPNEEQSHSPESPGEGSHSDLLAQLAQALAERNRIINSNSKSKNKITSSGSEQQPPFVLVHLETFTKKSNKTTPFGFDEETETNYANGTIIYPTLTDPTILASTKFEFENLDDVQHVFDRPLEGYKNGGMKPIVPLGLVDIQNYLRLLFEVHVDIHEGGRAKVEELKGLSYTVDRQIIAGAKTMDEWHRDNMNGRYKDNWLHTSTIGIRSISDYPTLPPKLPIPYPTF